MKVPPLHTFLDHHAIRDGTLVVAFSGGPDSLALLRAVHSASAEFHLRIIAAHLNHELRAEESDADEAFVTSFCEQNGIELRVEKRNIRRAALEQGHNLEGVARRLRYKWLIDVAHDGGAKWIATGHTADDQAETVLHNLFRGTGLRGLRGIAPRRPLAPGVEVIRPLLKVTRQEVESFLKAEQLTARQDSSNLDLRFTRNRIRRQLIPFLQMSFNTEIVSLLVRLSEQAAEFYEGQEAEVQAILARAEKPRAGNVVVLDVEKLARVSRNLVREVFHLIWERENWPLSQMDFAAWDRLAGLVFDADAAHDLPGSVHASRKGSVLQLRFSPKK